MKRLWIEAEQLLGDYLIQTPAIRGLRRMYPEHQIVYLTSQESSSRPLAENTPEINLVLSPLQGTMLKKKGEPYFKGDAGVAFSVGVRAGCTMAEAYCKLWGVDFDGGHYSLKVPDNLGSYTTVLDEQKQYRDWLNLISQKPYVICGRHSRSCTSNDPKIGVANKCFSNKVWLEISDYLEDKGIAAYAVGTSSDAADMTYSGWRADRMIYGHPIMFSAALIQNALLTISVDTGIRHIAAAVGGNLLTINHAIPTTLIRCEPVREGQYIAEPTLNIHTLTFDQIRAELDKALEKIH